MTYGDPITLKIEEYWDDKTDSYWNRPIEGWPCLRCGALVMDRDLHDISHGASPVVV